MVWNIKGATLITLIKVQLLKMGDDNIQAA